MSVASTAPDDTVARADKALHRYAGFGCKRAGGPGDTATGEWIEGELARMGYAVHRQTLPVCWIEDRVSTLTCVDRTVPVIGYHASPGGSVQGRLIRFRDAEPIHDVADGIAVIDLAHDRWSSARDPRIESRISAAIEGGARAVVVVTDGPSGLATALNTGPGGQEFARPVAVLGPREAERLLGQEGHAATLTLTLTREEMPREAFNVIGHIERGMARTIVLSTPRSGWFDCVGERGSGLAAWLLMVEQAARVLIGVNVTVLCSTQHERGYRGAQVYLADGAPPVDRTALWVHIGANAATRDFRDVRGRLMPLPSPDAQRFLSASAMHLADARACFRGAAGLELAHDVAQGVAGELVHIVAAGYGSVVGVFGAHRFHHTQADDLSCASGELSADLAIRMMAFVERVHGRAP